MTIRDVASLAPVVGTAGMEPRGWMIVGLPTNFFADTQAGIATTSLLGRQAEVRFTPRSFNWDYGDGTTRSTSSGGVRWTDSGLREFSTTETSHVYSRPGQYSISLTVSFTAEYRFGAGAWRTLAGTVQATANRLEAVAKDAATVLVGGECGRREGSPGC